MSLHHQAPVAYAPHYGAAAYPHPYNHLPLLAGHTGAPFHAAPYSQAFPAHPALAFLQAKAPEVLPAPVTSVTEPEEAFLPESAILPEPPRQDVFQSFRHALSYTDSQPQNDIFRDTPVRYVGFANDLTESLKGLGPLFAKANPLGWAATFGYGGLDAISKARQGYHTALDNGKDTKKALGDGAYELSKGLGFHVLATWVTPILILHKVKDYSAKLLKKSAHHPAPAAAALLSIPLITKTLDPIVESGIHALDHKLGKNTDPA